MVGQSTGNFPPRIFYCQYCSFPNTKEPLYSYTLLLKLFLYIILWPHSQSYNIWLISSTRASDVSYHWVFTLSPNSMCMDTAVLVLSNIQNFYWVAKPFFIFYFFLFRLTKERQMGIFWWSPNTAIDITINYFYCIIIVFQSSLLLVYSKVWERLVCFFLLWIFPMLG